MSNLSDLLPAGAGAKVITATADGNLATGQTIALQSNGTVKGIASDGTSITEAAGTAAVYESAQSDNNAIAYDSTNKKLLIAYEDNGNSQYGTAVVAELSGTTLTYGTPVVFYSTGGISDITIVYASGSGKFVITWNASGGRSIVATVSGTSVSFGSELRFDTGSLDHTVSAYDSANDKVVVAYQDGSNSDYGYARVGTVSGTSISFDGSTSNFNSGQVYELGMTYDATSGKLILVYGSTANSAGNARVGTISGNNISWGSAVTYDTTSYTRANRVVHDVSQNKIFVAFRTNNTDTYGIVGTVSGTSISFGTRGSLITTSSHAPRFQSVTYHTAAQKVVYTGQKSNNELTAIAITISDTSFSKGSDVKLADSGQEDAAVYDSTEKQVVVAYRDGNNSNYGTAITYTPAYTATNSADFAGITNQAINNSASGEVVVEGGVITNGSLLPPITTASYGSEVVFEAGYMRYPAIVYDTVNDKIVIAYADYDDSYKGKAVVGTVSGTSISYGSIVEFNSASTDYVTAVFDASAGKVVIGYRDAGNSSYGTAIVGTVSGTSISFGTEVVFESASSAYLEASYDTNASKTLFVYSDGGNSDVLTAQVGTVSGTSISFGGASALNSHSTIYIAIAYDSTAQKHVVFFANNSNSNRGDACVVTISGTSMSAGSFTTGVAANAFRTAVAYDANANKSVIFFSDADNSNIGKAIIGTVSGTSIGVGTAVTWNSTNVGFDAKPAFYDPTTTKVIIGYLDTDDSNKGKTKIGTVDGDTITFGDAVVFNSTSTSGGEIAITKDTDNNKLVIAYRDSGNSNYGTSVVGTLSSGIPNFTIGSTYYVQDDGTLSTTSSSVTAGKAIANTTLLLKG